MQIPSSSSQRSARMAVFGVRWPGRVACAGLFAFLLPLSAIESSGPPEPGLDIRRDATVDAIERVMPAVVNVGVVTAAGEQSAGSGVVVDEAGYVLTNDHVVRGSREIWVKFNDDRKAIRAEKVAWTGAKDVALLRLLSPPGTVFKAVKFGRGDDLLLGETVIALGNPFGVLGGSVSRGILSSKNRRRPEDLPQGEFLDIADWLQTDASVNPGYSGGPLINLRGEMIGLNVAILSPQMGAQGISFAIPIKSVSSALAEILSGEFIRGYWFGARLKTATRPLGVQSVSPGSPADTAGLKAGDIIVSVFQDNPASAIDFNRMLVDAGDEKPIPLLVSREGSRISLVLRLTREKDIFNNSLLQRRLGLAVRPSNGAFLITSVEADGPASRTGALQTGMYIASVDEQTPQDVIDFAKLIHRKAKGESVEIGIVARVGRGIFSRLVIDPVEVRLR